MRKCRVPAFSPANERMAEELGLEPVMFTGVTDLGAGGEELRQKVRKYLADSGIHSMDFLLLTVVLNTQEEVIDIPSELTKTAVVPQSSAF